MATLIKADSMKDIDEERKIDDVESTESSAVLSVKSSNEVMSGIWALAKEEQLWTRMLGTKHRKASKVLHKVLHSINVAYPPRDVLQPIDLNQESALMNQLRYAMRHSVLALRPSCIAYTTGTWSLMFKSHKSVLKRYLEISDKDIILNTCSKNMKRWKFRVNEPGYYLMVDHNTKRIVLSIRSSQSFGDVITDLNANPCAFTVDNINGKVHEGMLQSAYSLKDAITEPLLQTCALHEDYKMVITGHSLGGGVAALLGLMYKDHPIIRQKHGLKVYAFASPCIVSKEFTDNEIGSDFITSIAVNCDMVTRLSVQSVKKYNWRQDLMMNQRESVVEALISENNERRKTANVISSTPKETAESRALSNAISSVPNDSDDELYQLGRPLWFVPNEIIDGESSTDNEISSSQPQDDDTELKEDPEDLRQESTNSSKHTLCDASSYRYVFQDLVMSFQSWTDHYPGVYLKTCGASL